MKKHWTDFRITVKSPTQNRDLHLPQLSKAGSFLLSHLSLRAYLSILSLASTLTTLNPSSTNMMESTLKKKKKKNIIVWILGLKYGLD